MLARIDISTSGWRVATAASLLFLASASNAAEPVTLSTETLRNKIKGAWAAQTIGVTYGFPVEFRFNSVRVPDDHEIPWYDGYLLETFTDRPGAYDDIYMDLTFVQVYEDQGFDAPAQAFAEAFANADYSLWFANQVARYNILNGMAQQSRRRRYRLSDRSGFCRTDGAGDGELGHRGERQDRSHHELR